MKYLVLGVVSAVFLVSCERSTTPPSVEQQQLEQQNVQNSATRQDGGAISPASPSTPANPVVPTPQP